MFFLSRLLLMTFEGNVPVCQKSIGIRRGEGPHKGETKEVTD